MNRPRQTNPDLQTLLGLFYRQPQDLGGFEEVAAEQLPEPFGRLLAHNAHMTVTVESFHETPVDVRVLQTAVAYPHYSRKILLTRKSDGGVVQFGIVRLNFAYLAPEVRREIESEATPLGRILIEHNVLREVQLSSLWKVAAGEDLQRHFKLEPGAVTYGRTALIYCDGEPAVELLEIVAPC